MSKLPYFCWYPADAEMDQEWIAMPYDARGVYMTLLNRSWINNGIPGDPKELARQLGITYGKFEKIWERVGMKFTRGEDGKLYNKRQEEERSKANSKSGKASAAAGVRWDKQRGTEAIQLDMRSHTECNAEAMPRTYDSGSVCACGSRELEEPKPEDLSDWAEQRYAKHPKHKNKFLSLLALNKHFANNPEARKLFERNHNLWCETEEWRTRPQFVPPLADEKDCGWIPDEAWKHPPPRAAPAESESPPKPLTEQFLR